MDLKELQLYIGIIRIIFRRSGLWSSVCSHLMWCLHFGLFLVFKIRSWIAIEVKQMTLDMVR